MKLIINDKQDRVKCVEILLKNNYRVRVILGTYAVDYNGDRRLIIGSKTDRETLAVILAEAGHTTWIDKSTVNGKSVNYVEYEEKET